MKNELKGKNFSQVWQELCSSNGMPFEEMKTILASREGKLESAEEVRGMKFSQMRDYLCEKEIGFLSYNMEGHAQGEKNDLPEITGEYRTVEGLLQTFLRSSNSVGQKIMTRFGEMIVLKNHFSPGDPYVAADYWFIAAKWEY